eukprot:SAG31_NODE_2228_length_6146_cov_4.401191_7_plen_154_part_00
MRIEGLLNSFPKLVDMSQQHTYIETESVRFVYTPLEDMFLVIITTKNSNMMEDLETLRLLSRCVPEQISSCEIAPPSASSVHCVRRLHSSPRAHVDMLVAAVPLYGRELVNEDSVRASVFEIIFAFDEVIAPHGYKENLTVQAVKTRFVLASV